MLTHFCAPFAIFSVANHLFAFAAVPTRPSVASPPTFLLPTVNRFAMLILCSSQLSRLVSSVLTFLLSSVFVCLSERCIVTRYALTLCVTASLSHLVKPN